MNRINLVGRLGKNPETQQSASGRTYVRFSLATNDGYGETKKTNWHSCVAFGKTGEILAKYVGQGDFLAVSGRLEYNKTEDKVYSNVIVGEITLISSGSGKSNTESSTSQDDDLPY